MLRYDLPTPMMIGWGLSEVLSYLQHLELAGEVQRVGDGEDGELWRLRAPSARNGEHVRHGTP